VATVTSVDKIKLLTFRATNFEKTLPTAQDHGYPKEELTVTLDGVQGSWLNNSVSVSESVDLTQAKYVVSGGRGMKNGENFAMLHDLAKVLGT